MKINRHAKIIELINTYQIGTQEELAEYLNKEGFKVTQATVSRDISGMAMAVAAAIDALKWNEVVGCIAGDDTVMCAIRSAEDTVTVMDKIRKIVL